VRTSTYQGQPHLVVPVVALVAGVVNGMLVEAHVLEDSVMSWSGVPLMVGHPQDGQGRDISANHSPQVAEQVIGRLWQCTVSAGRLRGELWINLAMAEALGGAAWACVERLRAGEELEVSTGFFATVQTDNGAHDGEPYQGIYQHIRPDHLALLPEAIGACSWEKGCGAPRINTEGYNMLLTDPRITTLIGRCQCADTEANRQALAALPEAMVVALAAEPEPQAEEESAEDAPTEETPADDDTEEEQTLDAALARIRNPAIREYVAEGVAVLSAQKRALITALVAAKCPMQRQELERKSSTELRQFHAMMGLGAQTPSYLGQGLAQPLAPADETAQWAPLSILAKKD
jgi:hypothetical protein